MYLGLTLDDYNILFFLTWSFFARISVVSWSPLRSILFPTSITGTPLQKCLTSFAHCTSTFASESGLNKEWKLLCIADYKSSKENFLRHRLQIIPNVNLISKIFFDWVLRPWVIILHRYRYCIFATFKFWITQIMSNIIRHWVFWKSRKKWYIWCVRYRSCFPLQSWLRLWYTFVTGLYQNTIKLYQHCI